MSNNSSKISLITFAIIAFIIWAGALGVGFYIKLNAYLPPAAEELRSNPEIISSLAPSIAFNCYGQDESKIGSDLKCENELLFNRDRMIYFIKMMRIFMLSFFIVPLTLWIIYTAFPNAFSFIRQRIE